MKKIVLLSREDCYCDLITFYENVARKASIEATDTTEFDCRKICATKSVQEVLFSYYREEEHKTNWEIGAIFLGFGPKAMLNERKCPEYWADIEDGFVNE